MSEIDDMIKEYGYINFKVSKEEWSEYLLADKTLIRIKTIPVKIVIDDKGFRVNAVTCVGALSPKELKGTPSKEQIHESNIKDLIERPDLAFEAKNEPWNEYELEDGTKILLKTIILQASKIKLYDEYGDPVYHVNHQLISKKYPI